MDWFQRWPKDALIAVADHFLKEFEIVAEPAVKQELIQAMGSVHDGVAENCVQYFLRSVLVFYSFSFIYICDC